MEILFITWNYPPRRGGIENMMAALRAGLSSRHFVKVITSHVRPGSEPEQDILRAPMRGLIPFAIYALLRGAFELTRQRGSQIIFGGSALVAPLVLLLARLFGCKAVVQVHGLDIAYSNVFYRQLCVRWLKRCDGVIANSTYTAALAHAAGVDPQVTTIIPPGVDCARFQNEHSAQEMKHQYGLSGKKIILFVGRLVERKGVKEFIAQVLPRVMQKVPDAYLVVIGEIPSASLVHRYNTVSPIYSAAHDHGVETHIRMVGSVSDDALVDWYCASDLVVLPALQSECDVEGFGMVLLEAAAAAKPVVATRVGGIPDAVSDGRSGVLVEPDNYLALTDAVINILTDGEKRPQMGDYARRRVQAEFSWDRIVARYEATFGLLLPEIGTNLRSIET